MKKILTNLGVLLICAMVTLVGCTDFSADLEEVSNRVTTNEQAIQALKKEIADLKTEFVTKYATLTEIDNVLSAVAALQESVDAKASKDDVLAAIAKYEKMMESLGTSHISDIDFLKSELEAHKAELAAVKKALNDMANNGGNDGVDGEDGKDGEDGVSPNPYDHTALENAIANLQNSIQTLASDFNAYKTEIKEALDTINGQLETISTAVESIPELKTEVENLNDALALLKSAIEEQNNAIAGKASVEDLAALQQKVNQMSESVDNKLIELENEIRDLIADSQYDDSELLEKLNTLNAQYNEISGKLQNMEAAIEELRSVLRSIVAVPQIMDNGTKAIMFKSFSYLPLKDDNTLEETRIVKYEENGVDAFYLFNPSIFDITKATYSVIYENVEFVTKSSDAPISVVGNPIRVNDGVNGKVKIALKRGGGAGNMFALVATLKDGAQVYSDYVRILDSQIKGEDFVLVNANNEPVAVNASDAEVITMKAGEKFDFNPYIKVDGLDYANYGLALRFTLEEGALEMIDGVATPAAYANGTSLVKVELVDPENNKVIKRGYLSVMVKLPGTYISAYATASVDADRIAFEVKAIPTWVQALKDQPNTIELIKNAALAVKEGRIDKAIEILNGVPGFVTYTKTFIGKGEATVRVADNLEEALESMLPEIDNIHSVADLREFLVKFTSRYENSAYMTLLNNIKISDYIPGISYITGILEKFAGLLGESRVESITGQLNNIISKIEGASLVDLILSDEIFNALNTLETAILPKYIDINMFDLAKVKEKLIDMVTAVEGNVAADIIKTAEEAATLEATASACAKATENLVANFNEANDQIEANFENGTWGIAAKVIKSDIATKAFEKLELADVQAELIKLCDYGLTLAQYDKKDLLNTKITEITTEKFVEE